MAGDSVSVKPCAKCGVVERSARGKCKACDRRRHQVARAAAKGLPIDPAKAHQRAEQQARWQRENPDKMRAACQRYRERHPDRAGLWAKKNPERHKANLTAYREQKREKCLALTKAWNKAHPDAVRTLSQNRRARKRRVGGKLSSGLRARLFESQRGKCACCAQPLGPDAQLDHIVPLALGGANEDWNMQLLLPRCNQQKGAKHPVDFMRERGRLI